jgi:hypothetical protein
VLLNALEYGARNTLVPCSAGDEHTPDFGCFLIKRAMCAHADGARGSESNKVDTSRWRRTIRRARRKRIVKFGIQLLSLKRSFFK